MTKTIVARHFGALTVVSTYGRMAVCVCECGTKTTVWITNLYTGNTRSCGCVRNTAGGLSKKVPEYGVWYDMVRRCEDKTDSAFHNYGGRGIKVCERWTRSFPQFLADMGPRPSKKHTIERINNNGNYETKNCRWAPQKEQARNMRKTVYVTFRGKRQYLGGWARELGLPYQTLLNRLRHLGWSVKRALTTPRQGRAYKR